LINAFLKKILCERDYQAVFDTLELLCNLDKWTEKGDVNFFLQFQQLNKHLERIPLDATFHDLALGPTIRLTNDYFVHIRLDHTSGVKCVLNKPMIVPLAVAANTLSKSYECNATEVRNSYENLLGIADKTLVKKKRTFKISNGNHPSIYFSSVKLLDVKMLPNVIDVLRQQCFVNFIFEYLLNESEQFEGDADLLIRYDGIKSVYVNDQLLQGDVEAQLYNLFL
jgi:hypothetical protein